MTARPVLLVLLVVAASGCASQSSMYHWGAYDSALYGHYRKPAEREAWVEALKTALLEAEREGRRVPPGLYAEYGYALLEEGKSKEAVTYFEKEKAKWPESTVLMQKMIRNAGQRPIQPAALRGPAGQVEVRK
jgi:hypothetical protein